MKREWRARRDGARARWVLRWARTLVEVAAATGWLALLAGCGLASNPQPPTLWLPAPVKDLTATRAGDEVHLHWTMPKETTDKVVLKGEQRAHVCWTSGTVSAERAQSGKAKTAGKSAPAAQAAPGFDVKACRAAGDGVFALQKPAEMTVKLPADLARGTPRAVSFFVELENHAGKTAGPSNAVLVAAGAAPAAVAGLRLETRAQGVVLHWDAAEQAGLEAMPGEQMVLRIHRVLVEKAAAAKANESNGVPPQEQQLLEVDLDKADPGVALDRDAALDQEWKYWAERVVRLKADGQALEIAGAPSETVDIDAKDVFPPAVPAELAAVADAEAKAIDLSWTPDTEADLAGYVVYRRDVTEGGGAELVRISPKGLVVPPSFVDGTVVAGHRYAYAVSAVDRDGNESQRSGEVEEGLPE